MSCNQGTHKYMMEQVGKGFYEVIGTLGANGTISEMNAVFMGDSFDTSMYVDMVKLSHQYPDIF